MGHDAEHAESHKTGGADAIGDLLYPQRQKALHFGGTDEYTSLELGFTSIYRVLFGGKTLMGTPTNIKLMVWKEGNSSQMEGRMIGAGGYVAPVSTLVGTGFKTLEVVDMGTLDASKMGDDPTLWGLEIRRVGGSGSDNMHCYGGVILW